MKKNNQSVNTTENAEFNPNLDGMDPEKLKVLQQYESKTSKSNKKKAKFAEKLDMYDMIVANMVAGNSIIEPEVKLDNSQIHIGFSNIASDQQLTKYFMINRFPDFLQTRLIDVLRSRCMNKGVKINFYFHAAPHRIDWESSEMKNRMSIWKQYSDEHSNNIDVFSYRNQRKDALARNRIIMSTKYLNEAELEHKRSFMKVFFIIEVSAKRDSESLQLMADTIGKMKDICKQSDIKLTELRINLIDWIRMIGPFCLNFKKEMNSRLARKVITDDILANFNSFKQGRIGTKGVSLGIDVLNGGPVMRKFKEDPDAADNWLVSASTGGGKSYWVKSLLTYLLADGFVVSVMDYEGDEYDNLANFIKAGNPQDVKIVSMGKGSAVYFDPCEIAELTGDMEVDTELKDSAVSFIIAIFRTIVHGMNDNFTKEEEKIMSIAIQRMYDSAGVTDDMNTWYRSKGLRLIDVYSEIVEIVESKEFVDGDENLKHRAAVNILDSASIYFEPGETKSGTFKKPMSANELYKAKCIIFSFGMRGADQSSTDPTILALKQLSVAYVNIQISNYCKYVRHCFNAKVWEEFQRWGTVQGSAQTIANVITGGRKRGDVNFIITNDLASMLDDNNAMNKILRQNIQNFAIGRIKDRATREEFCAKFEQQDIKIALDKIAKANSSVSVTSGASANRYKNAFCLTMDDGKKAVVKVELPKALRESKLFKTGVDRTNSED